MKKTNKKQKYTYTVDLRTIETLSDIAPMWAFAKHEAGLALSDEELADICSYVYTEFSPKVTVIYGCSCCRIPWYKRFWRWITKFFKKNK